MSTGGAGHVTRSFAVPNSETADQVLRRRFLTTDDGVTIDAVYEPGGVVYDASTPLSGNPSTPYNPSDHVALVVAHGFTGDVDRPHVRRVAEAFAQYGAVVTFSFRGHGASGGRSTVGDREVLDLAAAVHWARELGHTRVVTVGFSMGGSVVLRHAALYGGSGRQEHEGRTGAAPDAVVSVSAAGPLVLPGDGPHAARALADHPSRGPPGRPLRPPYAHPPPGLEPRTPLPGGGGAPDSAEAPADRARRPGRLLPGGPPRMLAEAAGDAGELWLEPGMGHAEHAAGEELLRRIGDWAVTKAG